MSPSLLLFYILLCILAGLGLFGIYIYLMSLKDWLTERKAKVLALHSPDQMLLFHGRLFKMSMASFESGKSGTLTFRTLEEYMVENGGTGTYPDRSDWRLPETSAGESNAEGSATGGH